MENRLRDCHSLLAREINWLETWTLRDLGIHQRLIQSFSLLAREINWLETRSFWNTIINVVYSLLAREINWLETNWFL